MVYLLPGRGNTLGELGDIISQLDFEVYGREFTPPFSMIPFSEQIEIIQNDLYNGFWNMGSYLVGHSYGAYLLLHALLSMEPFQGKILLFSPVLGAAIDKSSRYASYPPRFRKLLSMAEERQFPIPRYVEVHTGENDEGCDYHLAEKIFAHIPGSRVVIVNDQGHTLPNNYVSQVIYRFLKDQ